MIGSLEVPKTSICATQKGAEFKLQSEELTVETRLKKKKAKALLTKASKLTDSRQTLERRRRWCRTSTRSRWKAVLRKTGRADSARYGVGHRSPTSVETHHGAALPATPPKLKGHCVHAKQFRSNGLGAPVFLPRPVCLLPPSPSLKSAGCAQYLRSFTLQL